MNVTCQTCNAKINIPDHKIPMDRESALKCPNCKGKILIPAIKQPEESKQSKQSKPAEKETVPPVQPGLDGRLNALICIGESSVRKKIHPLIRQMGMKAEAVPDVRSALDRMEYHVYQLVVIDDAFDRNQGLKKIIERMNTIDMSLRRQICLVLVSRTFSTNDSMVALHTSVNNIFNVDDMLHLEPFLSKTLQEHKNVYTVYNESLKQAGRA